MNDSETMARYDSVWSMRRSNAYKTGYAYFCNKCENNLGANWEIGAICDKCGRKVVEIGGLKNE